MTPRVPDGNRVVHKLANLKLRFRLISALKIHKPLKRECKGYLCTMVDSIAIKPSVESIPLVCEFWDVFSEEIPGMPPYAGKWISLST